MILIITSNNDISTTKVIKWLIVYKKKFLRINEDEIFDVKIDNKKIYLKSNQNKFYLDEITSLWYRRGRLNIKYFSYKNVAINLHMNEVQHWVQDYIIKTLESKKHINKQSNSDINKLLALEEAINVGLDVPEYFLDENMDNVSLGNTITKSIAGNTAIEDYFKNHDGVMYTKVIEKKVLGTFYLSFFQEKIEKDYEIRSFYLNGEFFSMAIFSQNDDQTKIDYRNYNDKNPNRNVRYNLPKEIENKIHLLMQRFDLNCGSIDLIKSGEKFYFLEINTIGQFDHLSLICNYNLEKKIATYL